MLFAMCDDVQKLDNTNDFVQFFDSFFWEFFSVFTIFVTIFREWPFGSWWLVCLAASVLDLCFPLCPLNMCLSFSNSYLSSSTSALLIFASIWNVNGGTRKIRQKKQRKKTWIMSGKKLAIWKFYDSKNPSSHKISYHIKMLILTLSITKLNER